MSTTTTQDRGERYAAWVVNHAKILAIAARINRERGGLVTTAELRGGSGLSPEGLHRHLRAMERDGELVRHGMGLWLPGREGEGL